MRYFILFNNHCKEVSWVIWLRCQYCINPTYHTMLLLLRGGEMPGGPALFMRPPPDHFIFRPPPNIRC